MVEEIFAAFRHPFELFFDPSQRLSFLHMGAALAFAIFVFYRSRKNLKGLIKWLLPWDILTHKSAKADYVMFFVNKSIIAAIYASVLMHVSVWYALVEKITGPAGPGPSEPSWTISASIRSPLCWLWMGRFGLVTTSSTRFHSCGNSTRCITLPK
ncbi:hypothetical protein ABLN87_02405 [Ruegeria sp. SCPT10]|uniref:hypothetical protein n=1 Tax=Ruegeria sp. SCP10 TaxID=3141377 RepID=UPI00333C4403